MLSMITLFNFGAKIVLILYILGTSLFSLPSSFEFTTCPLQKYFSKANDTVILEHRLTAYCVSKRYTRLTSSVSKCFVCTSVRDDNSRALANVYLPVQTVRDLFHVYLNTCKFHFLLVHIDKTNKFCFLMSNGCIHSKAISILSMARRPKIHIYPL